MDVLFSEEQRRNADKQAGGEEVKIVEWMRGGRAR